MDRKLPPSTIQTVKVDNVDPSAGSQGMMAKMFQLGPQIAAQMNQLGDDQSVVAQPVIMDGQPANAFDGRPMTAKFRPETPAPTLQNTIGGQTPYMNTQDERLPHPLDLLPPGHNGMSVHSKVYNQDDQAPRAQEVSPNYQTGKDAHVVTPPMPGSPQARTIGNGGNNGSGQPPTGGGGSSTMPPARPMPGTLNLVPNYAPTAESTLADTDARYMELPTPPSRNYFYSWTRMSIRKMSTAEVRKAYQAHQTESFRHFAQLLSSTLDRPYLQLTLYDFWWCMYYHQQNSFPKAPGTATYTCENQVHHDKVKLGHLHKDTLIQKAQIHRQDLEEIEITEEQNLKAGDLMQRCRELYNVILYPPTVQDAIELTEDKELVEERSMLNHLLQTVKTNPDDIETAIEFQKRRAEYQDFLWINEMASWLHPVHGATIADRRAFLESGEVDLEVYNCIEEFQQLTRHGIVERIKTTCTVCAGENVIPVTISPAHFLPALQRAKLV